MRGKTYTKEPILIDLFAGAGGISEGFRKAGFKIISANEFDLEIATTYSKNHPETKVLVKDIASIKPSELLNGHKEVDVIVGGPPCQGFSMAGKRIRDNGAFLGDPRNQLFYEFYRIVKAIRPKVFLMENVPAILNMRDGSIKNRIINIFSNLGYKTDVNVLLAANFGVPQMRKRAVFIGNRLDISPEKMYPEETHGPGRKLPYVTAGEAILDLPLIKAGDGTFENKYDKKEDNSYQRERRKNSKILYNHQAPRHSKKIVTILKMIEEGQGRSHLPKTLQTKSIHSGAFGRIDRLKPAYTITTRFDTPSVGRVTHPIVNRSLTPREAARIQSFDDNFIFIGSRSSVGKQIGNAVPPLMAYAIAKQIIKFLK